MSEDEFEAARERLEALRERVRQDLAEDLGGEPEEYDSSRYVAADGGDS